VDEIRMKKSNQNALNTRTKHALEHPSRKVSTEEVTQQMAELSLQKENEEDVKTAKRMKRISKLPKTRSPVSSQRSERGSPHLIRSFTNDQVIIDGI
jgi:hypothetical protein